MKIKVNGELKLTAAKNLEELCRELGVTEARIATARNGEFVPAATREKAGIAEGDAIEILSPRQGG